MAGLLFDFNTYDKTENNIGKKVRNQHFFLVPNFNVIGSKSYLVLRKTESSVSKKISNVFGQTKKVYIDFSFGWSPRVRILSLFFRFSSVLDFFKKLCK